MYHISAMFNVFYTGSPDITLPYYSNASHLLMYTWRLYASCHSYKNKLETTSDHFRGSSGGN